MSDESIAVIVPVHNAAAFLADALRSALGQTYPATEIIVVDDGSTDASPDIARRFARGDSRIRVLHQDQRGPSAARNLGIDASLSALIAPLDADDLWRPTKLERQILAMRSAGHQTALVYTWFALIDEEGIVLSLGHQPMFQGRVLRECYRRNIVGNGSGALMRRAAVVECGGYDELLQGCEDYQLYTAIAERYEFAVVPEHLTGYRQTKNNLTSQTGLILSSAGSVLAELQQRHPEFENELRENMLDICHWLMRRAALAADLKALMRVTVAMWQVSPGAAVRSLALIPVDLLPPIRDGKGTSCGAPFLTGAI
jgi:glycosyltransferase involved in cell wall biosynthesis